MLPLGKDIVDIEAGKLGKTSDITHIRNNIIVLQEVTREYLFNLRIITYGL